MDSVISRKIANGARKKFVSAITGFVNSMYYRTQDCVGPATGDDVPAPVTLSMSDIGLKEGDITLPESDYYDENVATYCGEMVIVGVCVSDTGEDSNKVTGFVTRDGRVLDCEYFSLNEICSLCVLFEDNWRKMYNK